MVKYLFKIDKRKVPSMETEITNKELLELPIEQSFHSSSPLSPHPLDTINVLITGGMGNGLVQRLAAKGIQGIVLASNKRKAKQIIDE